MAQMITDDLVRLDADLGTDKHDVIRALAAVVDDAGRATDADQLAEDALAREATAATGLNGGIAIPHCRSAGVETPTLAFARLSPRVEFGAKDGPADLAFLIAAPAGGDASHLQVLAKLARALVKKEFTDASAPRRHPPRSSRWSPGSSATSRRRRRRRAAAAPAGQPPAAAASTPTASGARSLVAVTACPTGIAHTYMAAEALEAAAARAGVAIHVETQGSAGSKPLPRETIAAADAVIFAVDVGVRDRGRFAGKPVVSSGVKRPIDDGDAMIAEALRYADDPNAAARRRCAAGGGAGGREARRDVGRAHPPRPDDRCLVHDPVRRGGRSADRPQLPVRRLRDRRSLRRDRGQQHDLQPARPPGAGSGACPVRLGLLRLHRRALLHHRQDRVRALHPGAGRLHRLRHRRPAGHRTRVRHGWPGRQPVQRHRRPRRLHPGTGFLGAIAGGVLAGLLAHWIASWTVPVLGSRPDAGAGDPAPHLRHRRPDDDHRPRQADRLADGTAERGPEQHERQRRHPAGRRPRPDDGLRHGWPAQQGRLQLRRRRARRPRAWPTTHPS